MELRAQLGRGFPFAAFVCECQLIGRTQSTGLAQQYVFDLAIEGHAVEYVRHRHFEHGIKQRKKAEQEQIRISVWDEWLQKLAKTRTDQGG